MYSRTKDLLKNAFLTTPSATRDGREDSDFRTLFHRLPAVVHTIDAQGRLIEVSDRWLEHFGYTREEVLGKRSVEFLSEESRRAAVNVHLPRLFREGTLRVDLIFQRKDGQVVNVQLSAVAEYDRQGKVVRAIAILEDTTERRIASSQLETVYTAVEQSPAMVVITDEEQRITYVNPSYSKKTGYELEEIIGKTPSILKSGATPEATYYELHRTLQAGKTWRGEFINRRKDGSTYWESASVAPVLNDRGCPSHFVKVAEDVTGRKDYERLKSTVDRVVRHDLRNMLTGIIEIPRTIADDNNLTVEQRDYLRLLERTGTMMLGLLNEQTALSRIESGEYRPPLKRVNVFAIARQVVAERQLTFGDRDVSIVLEFAGRAVSPSDRIHITGDEVLLYSTLSNLITNACEASHHGDSVRVTIQGHSELVKVSIWNAQPVPSGMRGRFFEKYATEGKTNGTGLGTYSAKLMTELMGGSIEVQTGASGTTVICSFVRSIKDSKTG